MLDGKPVLFSVSKRSDTSHYCSFVSVHCDPPTGHRQGARTTRAGGGREGMGVMHGVELHGAGGSFTPPLHAFIMPPLNTCSLTPPLPPHTSFAIPLHRFTSPLHITYTPWLETGRTSTLHSSILFPYTYARIFIHLIRTSLMI